MGRGVAAGGCGTVGGCQLGASSNKSSKKERCEVDDRIQDLDLSEMSLALMRFHPRWRWAFPGQTGRAERGVLLCLEKTQIDRLEVPGVAPLDGQRLELSVVRENDEKARRRWVTGRPNWSFFRKRCEHQSDDRI